MTLGLISAAIGARAGIYGAGNGLLYGNCYSLPPLYCGTLHLYRTGMGRIMMVPDAAFPVSNFECRATVATIAQGMRIGWYRFTVTIHHRHDVVGNEVTVIVSYFDCTPVLARKYCIFHFVFSFATHAISIVLRRSIFRERVWMPLL